MSAEVIIRLSAFIGLFALFAVLEALFPRRKRKFSRTSRWITHFSITVINTLALRILAVGMPFLAIGAALDAWVNGWGLFNQIAWPLWAEVLLSILILDGAIWAQHLITHKVPFLWRFHRMHHADPDMDVTTAFRFHPAEILASMGLKIGLVYLIGPPALAVLLFEVLLNGTALFTHANLRLPAWLDHTLRLVLVTPDMHRIHHSVLRSEHDSNYGFALSLWDRMFGTYVAMPQGGQDAIQVGQKWQDEKPTRLGWSLMLPFRR